MKQSLTFLLFLLLIAGCVAEAHSVDRQSVDTPSEESQSVGIPRGPRSCLLLTLDTTRADHLQPYAEELRTPALQQLAEHGVVMERAYAVSPLTTPTHSSILTGLYPPQHGVRTNGRHRLASTIPTLAERFAERGFRTAAFISAAVLERRYGLDRGFEVYDDDLSGDGSSEASMVTERSAGHTVAAALRWLDDLDGEERFFLWVHLFDPHASYVAPEPYGQRFADRPYLGEIAYMDAEIGRLLEHPRLRAEEDVVVMAIGDHGESLGEHGEKTHGLLAYDATLRIPWILRLPGGPRGVRWSTPVSQVDLVPTLLDAQDFAAGDLQLPGRSLLPFLEGEEPTQRSLYAESLDPMFSYGWSQLRVLRRDRWKYIEAPTPELYDLTRDPAEESNLFTREQQIGRALAEELLSFEETAELADAAQLPLDEATRTRLQSLGYIATSGSHRTGGGDRPDPKEYIAIHHKMQQAGGLIQDGRPETAETLLREILLRDPRNRQALLMLACSLFDRGDLENSVATLKQGLAYHPEDSALSLRLARIEAGRGNLERAVELSEAARASDPQQMEPWLSETGHLLALGRGLEAAELYEKAQEYFADDAELHLQMGLLMAAEGLAQAEDPLRQALRLGSAQSPEVHRALAELLTAQGRLDEARRIWEELTREDSDDATAFGNLAALALGRRDWTAAKTLAERAVAIDPSSAASWNSLGYALDELGQAPQAVAAYQRALAADPAYVSASFNLGLLLEKGQDFTAATEAFEGVLRHQPKHSEAHLELALLYAGPLGDPARARPHLVILLESAPDHPKASLLQELLNRIDAALGGS